MFATEKFLLLIFSTTMYSNRRKNKLNIYKQDIENFITEEKRVII